MCGRFEVFKYDEVVAIAAAVEGRAAVPLISVGSEPRAHVRPGGSVLLFGRNAELDELEIDQAIWGFEPDYAKRTVFNTRIESALAGSAMWKGPIQDGRCIIPAAAFYEPHATETVRSPKTGRLMKRQYRFASPDDEPLLLAGVQQDGRCSIVTCEPNQWVSPVHDRMPLVLRFEEVVTWLSSDWPALADRSRVQLAVQPEAVDSGDAADQLSLF
ncbi:MAG: SOS response-associated peptidase family protein [Eggerthellaceae bacterium]|nr:SOS response-associated peptidase family protein [Eggerthellaceae bacterium]